MSAVGEEASGTWRKGRFVLWSDLLVPLHASLVWFGLFVVAIAIALPVMARQGVSPAQLRDLVPNLFRNPVGVQVVTATADLVMLFLMWRISRRVAEPSLIARYRSVSRWLLLVAAIAGIALALVAAFSTAWLVAHEVVKFHPAANERIFPPGPGYQYPIILVTVALIAPFVEEFYFRGILLSWLSAKITVVPAALLSALIFGLVHLRFVSHPGMVGWALTGIIATVGLINAVFALRTRSLWPCFALHAAYNSSLAGLALVAPLLAR